MLPKLGGWGVLEEGTQVAENLWEVGEERVARGILKLQGPGKIRKKCSITSRGKGDQHTNITGVLVRLFRG